MTANRNLENLEPPENSGIPGHSGLQGHRSLGLNRSGSPNNAINSNTYKRMSISVDGSLEPCEDGFTMQKHAKAIRASETATTITIDPTRVNLLNQAHVSAAPIQSKTALLYVSGNSELTEFRVSDEGFSILVWRSYPVRGDKRRIELVSYRPAERGTDAMYRRLEVGCLSGLARLSDRAPVRGVGGNPENRASARATDDVATVCHWIARAEKWYDKRVAGQRKAILKGNAALAGEAVDSGDSKIPYLPPSMAFEQAAEAGNNADLYANVMPQFLNVGSVKHWDRDGALAMRGKRVSAGTTSRTLAGKRDRIALLRAMATRQVTIAAEKELAGDLVESEIYAEFAASSDARAQALQDELCARMAVARAARKAKAAGKDARVEVVTARIAALEEALEDISGNRAARVAACKVADADEAATA